MGSAPSPPDPYATAQAQGQANLQAAREQAAINMVNQVTPFGSLTYTKTGNGGSGGPGNPWGSGGNWQGGYGSGGGNDQPGGYTATQTYSPAVQAIVDQQLRNAGLSGGIGEQLMNNARAKSSQPLNLSYSALQGQMDAQHRRTLDPLWAQREEENRQQLYNRGITPGNAAYDSAQRTFDTSRNAAYDQAFLSDEQTAQNALVTEYNSPLNASQAWAHGAQIAPTPIGLTQTPTESIAPVPIANLIEQQYGQQSQNSQSAMGGLFGLGGDLLKNFLPLLSDRKDKTDIKKLGNKDGKAIYAYRYKGDPKTYPKTVGPMAPKGSPEIGGHKILFGLGGDV